MLAGANRLADHEAMLAELSVGEKGREKVEACWGVT